MFLIKKVYLFLPDFDWLKMKHSKKLHRVMGEICNKHQIYRKNIVELDLIVIIYSNLIF